MGGIDTQYLLATAIPQEVTDEFRARIALLVPAANYCAYLAAAERFGRYPLVV